MRKINKLFGNQLFNTVLGFLSGLYGMKDHAPFLVGLRKLVVWTSSLRIHLPPLLAQHLADLGDLQLGVRLFGLHTDRKMQPTFRSVGR